MQKLSRDDMAKRVAQDIPEGAYVNLGIGLPTRIANYLPTDKEVFLHSENGLLGMGPKPAPGEEDPELINAGKEFVTLLQGGCYFHHGDSFAMMRGGHLDICVLGAYQVSAGLDSCSRRRDGFSRWRASGLRDDGPPHARRRVQVG